MSRYYSDSDDEYASHRRRSDSVHASGWQSPSPTSPINNTSSSPSSSVTRIVVEPPFGSKKCDYNIDKSQRGRLVITARRRQTVSSDYRSSNNKNHVAIQTFTIPHDADVDRLQSHIERDTNRLIIEIPRQQRRGSRTPRSSYMNTSKTTSSRLLRSPDVERMLTSPTGGPQLIRDDTKSSRRNSGGNRKLEYRIDCRGYTADELEVFIQGRDLIVQGKTHTSTSPDPTQQRVSKKFTRKITLPNTVDLPKVVSYLEHGELRIEAPLKRGVYYSDEEIIIPGPPPSSSTSNRTTAALISNLENRVRSPSPQTRPHYRRNERYSRRRDYDRSNNRRLSSPTRRVRSVDSHRYPLYVPSRDLDEDDEDEDDTKEQTSRRQRTVNYARNSIDKKQTERPRSVYSPTNVITNATTSTIARHHNYPSDDDKNLRF
jgi:HSP20 family molecular chaperone IbpA